MNECMMTNCNKLITGTITDLFIHLTDYIYLLTTRRVFLFLFGQLICSNVNQCCAHDEKIKPLALQVQVHVWLVYVSDFCLNGFYYLFIYLFTACRTCNYCWLNMTIFPFQTYDDATWLNKNDSSKQLNKKKHTILI